jgi:eukaryotic-like serine/threonine-protein kinase
VFLCCGFSTFSSGWVRPIRCLVFTELGQVVGSAGNSGTVTLASGGVIHSSPALANGFIYFGSYDAKVYALNASNGTKAWSYLTQWIVHSSPCVDSRGNVYIGSDDSNLYSFKGATGAVNWATTLIEAIGSSPAVDLSGNLFVGDDDGIVYLLDTLTGWNIRRAIEGSIIDSSPVIVGNGQVIIGAQDGKLLRTTIH